ncbi:MAG: glycoside hydrolase family 3 C-terminal domain-containing protein [Crocinitomicaceae bacterium]|nr:glycoside hydrolase family 3 C-terminal domain-containing protein [Crocinitomicaceae bacterium]
MKNLLYYFGGMLLLLFSCKSAQSITTSNTSPEDKSLNVRIAQMSIEEKVGQTCQITLDVISQTDAKGATLTPTTIDTAKLNEAILKYHVGSVLNVGWHTLSLDEWKGVIPAVQRSYTTGKTNIPVIYGIDAIHGVNYTVGATLFPQEIGLAATWNPTLAKKFGEITAYETRASGIPWNFSPVLDLGRQPLWSRTFETLGEDPYLISQMGTAIIDGYQGSTTPDEFHVASCMKHFVGYSGTTSGRDRTPAWIPEKYMKELYLPSFKAAVEHGALTVMINSGAVNGIPGHINHHLITETLKEEWGFEGFAVSDWEDFIMLHTVHSTAPSLADAYVQAFNAGVDMSMVPLSPQYKEYCTIMVNAVKSGKISMDRLDDAVRRILRVKSRLGLFERPVPTFENYPKFGCAEFQQASLNTALESITLLKNENGILPLSKNQKVLIAGPTSNNLVYLNGAWTHTWQGVDTAFNTSGCLTVRAAFEKKLGKENCLYSQGAELYTENAFEKTRFVNLTDYKEKLKLADVVILCLGELPATEKPGDILSLNLDSEQRELAKMAYEQNKKVILVLLEGRPRIIHDIVSGASGIIQAYLPGNYGAEALVSLMLGEKNFSGKLPYTYPKFDGVIEFYDHPKSVDRSKSGDFSAYNPEWDFGYGLNYSSFEYTALSLNQTIFSDNDSIAVTVTLKNSSSIAGKEVIQLYVSDDYASLIPTGKSLKRFLKIDVPAQTEVSKTFYLNLKDFQFVGNSGEFIVEEGEFTIRVGNLTKKVSYKKK